MRGLTLQRPSVACLRSCLGMGVEACQGMPGSFMSMHTSVMVVAPALSSTVKAWVKSKSVYPAVLPAAPALHPPALHGTPVDCLGVLQPANQRAQRT